MALTCRWRSRPQHQKRTTHRSKQAVLFDRLVGGSKQRGRHDEGERLRGLEVDDKLKFSGLLYGQVGRTGTLEDFVNIVACTTKNRRITWSIGYEGACFHGLAGVHGQW